MRSYINSIVISFSVLAASASLAATQDAQSSQNTIVVGAGNDLRCRLEKGLRITKSGEPIQNWLSQFTPARLSQFQRARRLKDMSPQFPVRPGIKDSFCVAISRAREQQT